jgi:uncharacterized membrane protein YkvA (DUF1232 family)
MWWRVLIPLMIAVVTLWLLLVAALWLLRPQARDVKQSIRLLPDVLRMLSRLARDRTVPRAPRIWLWLLLVYLALPIDLVPDFVPVIGYADDAIIVILVLRHVARRVGSASMRERWPGTPEGFAAVCALAGIAVDGDGEQERPTLTDS